MSINCDNQKNKKINKFSGIFFKISLQLQTNGIKTYTCTIASAVLMLKRSNLNSLFTGNSWANSPATHEVTVIIISNTKQRTTVELSYVLEHRSPRPDWASAQTDHRALLLAKTNGNRHHCTQGSLRMLIAWSQGSY